MCIFRGIKKINGKCIHLILKIAQIYLMIKIDFFQTNDVNLSKIINKFSALKKGIDLLYIDSYHETAM